ncbi:hypothetical protein HRbin07_00116 [bacterium HR07]|uniref:Uncharacterized protein n=1 Tax=Acetithermum autotrophicum TaxID=1446466 RepID=H5SRA3_ACEAU|nr:hypothetical protein HGMM_OP2C170 [Candidatus Acetothermum autotrophicum]GBC75924.1 hypothetical protein HRbin07_00116 [bacterium HR07]
MRTRAALNFIIMVALGLAGAAQDCSVRSYGDGLCSDELVLSVRVQEDQRVTGAGDNLLIALATLPSEPVRISQFPVAPTPLIGLSYLTIQRFMLAPPSGESPEPQAIWDFGRVAQIEARLRDIDALMRAILEEFFRAHSSSPSNRELTLVLNIDSPGLFLPTQIETLSSFALDERLHLSLSRATITLRTAIGVSSIIGQLELNPKDLEISKEKIGLELSLGSALLSGITTFEHGVGLTSQVYSIRAQVGNVELIGQAVFTSTSQEFTIGASIAGLALSGSSLITPSGFTQSLYIQIPIIISAPKK